LDVEAQLRRFELGESGLVETVQPLDTETLARIAPVFAAQFEAAADLRYLNAVLKIIDREDFGRDHPGQLERLSVWAEDALRRLRRQKGLP
jgi:hypothetical protein